MREHASLGRIEVGQRVKVKGLAAADGILQAVEIEPREPKDKTVLEGVVRTIEVGERTLTLFGRCLRIPGSVAPLDAEGRSVPLAEVRTPALMKIVGRCREREELTVESLEIKKTLPFNIEKLQGHIAAIDRARGTLRIAGVVVQVTPLTLVGRFA